MVYEKFSFEYIHIKNEQMCLDSKPFSPNTYEKWADGFIGNKSYTLTDTHAYRVRKRKHYNHSLTNDYTHTHSQTFTHLHTHTHTHTHMHSQKNIIG